MDPSAPQPPPPASSPVGADDSPQPSSPSHHSPPSTPLDDHQPDDHQPDDHQPDDRQSGEPQLDVHHLGEQPPNSDSAPIAHEPVTLIQPHPQTPPSSPPFIPSDHQETAPPPPSLPPIIHHDDKENIPPDAWQQPLQQPPHPKAKKPLEPTKRPIPLSDHGIHKKSDHPRSPLRDITSAAVANRSTTALRRPRSPRRKPLNLRFAMR